MYVMEFGGWVGGPSSLVVSNAERERVESQVVRHNMGTATDADQVFTVGKQAGGGE
jgi:hypothetical protein